MSAIKKNYLEFNLSVINDNYLGTIRRLDEHLSGINVQPIKCNNTKRCFLKSWLQQNFYKKYFCSNYLVQYATMLTYWKWQCTIGSININIVFQLA